MQYPGKGDGMSEAQVSLITDEIRALIGVEADIGEAWDTVEAGAVRRFTQAIMDNDPAYWNEDFARNSKFGTTVAPPLYQMHSARRRSGTPDPLDALKENREWDGLGGGGRQGGLPSVDVPLKRILNGGTEAEFLQLAKPGDRIRARARYADIFERDGRTGKMVFIVTETTYSNQQGDVLARIRSTTIRR